MAISFIAKDSKANGNGATSSSLVPLVPAGTANGDYMLAFVYKNTTASATLNVPAGWTIVGSAVEDSATLATNCVVYSRTASSEPASYTWGLTGTAAVWGVIQCTFRGVNTTNPVAGSSGAATVAATATVAGPTVATTSPTVAVTFQGSRYSTAQDAQVSQSSSGDTEIDDWGLDGGATSRTGSAYYSTELASGNIARSVQNTVTTGLTGRIMFTVALRPASVAVSSSDTSGTTTETQAVVSHVPGNDVGSGTDANTTPNATLSSSDATGTTTETFTPRIVPVLSDTGTGTDSGTVQGGPAGSDTGSGTNGQSIAAALSSSDTGSVTETNSIVANLSSSDTGSGTNNQSVFTGNNPSSTDTGTASETNSIQVLLSSSDSATVIETGSVFTPPPPPPVMPDTLVMGPGSIYLADFAAVEPTTTGTPDSLVWTDLGGTLGGVDLSIEEDYDIIELVQMPDTQIRRLKTRRLTVKTQLAQPGLHNLVRVLNDNTSTIASGAGYTSYSASLTVSEATPLTYNAVLIRGWKPGYTGNLQKRRTVILRKALSTDNVEISYTKEDQSVYTVTWACHYVDGTTPPFKVIDEN